jgi:hypothetical protein
MLVSQAEQDWPPRSPPAGANYDTLLDHPWTDHAHAVTALRSDRQRVRLERAIATALPREECQA